MQSGLTDVALMAGLVLSVLICFAGFKLQKHCITLVCFILGLYIGYGAGQVFLPDALWMRVVACILLGSLLASLSYRIYLVGVGLFCGGLTCLTIYRLLMTWQPGEPFLWLVMAFAVAVVAGVVAVKNVRQVVIAISGIAGGLSAAVFCIQLQLVPLRGRVAVLLIGVILAIGGILTQKLTTKG